MQEMVFQPVDAAPDSAASESARCSSTEAVPHAHGVAHQGLIARFPLHTGSQGEHVPFCACRVTGLRSTRQHRGDVHIEAEHGRLILTNRATHMARVWESLA